MRSSKPYCSAAQLRAGKSDDAGVDGGERELTIWQCPSASLLVRCGGTVLPQRHYRLRAPKCPSFCCGEVLGSSLPYKGILGQPTRLQATPLVD